jgi:dihydroorotase
MIQFTLPLWYDLHTHLRQDALLAPILKSQIDMGCAGILAMPNTKPPVAKVLKSDDLPYWCIEGYLNLIKQQGGANLDAIIVPLYLTKDTTADMIKEGAQSGLLKACKYYPPHGTTGADFGYPFEHFMENGVFEALERHGIILCLHGEEHGLVGEDYFDRETNAEEYFYQNRMPKLVEKFPALKVACEHVTTKVAVDFVKSCSPNVVASITPQHLLYTVGHLLQGLKYHLFCLPLLKYNEDREARRNAATASDNTKVYAGTDSAAHTTKATDCGCAAGCFTGGIAPQLYAQSFEEAGLELSNTENQKTFEKFLCSIGQEFYGLEKPTETFTLSKEETTVEMLETPDGQITPLPLGLGQNTIPWKLTL